MKPKLRHFLLPVLIWAAFLSLPVYQTGCASGSSQQVNAVQTLKIIGQTAKSSMDASTQLLKQGSITVAQWQRIADFYDQKFQPTYSLAVAASRSDLSTIASPDLLALATQFASLVAQLTAPTLH